MGNFNEKRKHKRFKVNLPVDCSSVHFLQSKSAVNLSLGGIFIETNLLENPGTIIEMQFMFKDDWRKVTVLGEVTRTGETGEFSSGGKKVTGMGIKFINPPQDFLEKIEKSYLR